MDAVIPDVEAGAYEACAPKPFLEGRTESELINDAIRAYFEAPSGHAVYAS
jgi:hypothetical protein